MNRLVIVGNGFDLAHGLPTGYSDFINWYWSNLQAKYKEPEYQEILDINDMHSGFITNYGPIKSYNDTLTCLEEHARDYNHKFSKFNQECKTHGGTYIFRFKSFFFKRICKSYKQKNWVDIENEYYDILKDCLKEEKERKYKIDVITLNKEFKDVKNLLEKYLTENIAQKINFYKPNEYAKDILEFFKIIPRNLISQEGSIYLKEFPIKDHKELIEFDEKVAQAYWNGELGIKLQSHEITETNLFLNFNYTFTVNNYINSMLNNNIPNKYGYSKQIQIHGQLNSKDNEINFGFGDEMNSHYKLIEEKDDNEYLKNIKSFQYLQNSNYKDLLDFIDSEKFQVYIMGHSCGLSDRILLNTIFEHEHCRSIKVFYHEKDGKDNYTDIVQNISRHFNKKKMMRDKLVNKSLCQPLPQNIRFAPKQ